MSGAEDWLYHLPEFLDRVRERGAHEVRGELDVELGGVIYHHRGARAPAHDATFVWNPDAGTFDLELDAVGPRAAWAVFDADREWDFYLFELGEDPPCLAWMTDDEFAAEEAETFVDKEAAVGMARFSFGIYLQAPDVWDDVESRARETEAPCYVSRPDGQTLVPSKPLSEYPEVVPPELIPDGESPPAYLGLREAHVEYGEEE
jgi:hypothetical protein